MPTTILSLPLELRLKIYGYVLDTSNIHSLRPQRRIGWNRPHADLGNPIALFESDAHPALRQLFHGKLTKLDHPVILASLLRHIKILVIDHTDLAVIQKLSLAATVPSAAFSLSVQGRSYAAIVKDSLRTIDFSDKLDEIVCQPQDVVKLLHGLPGLKTVHLTSKHVQRYSGTIEEHVEFAQDRAKHEACLNTKHVLVVENTNANLADEIRRMSLRSPMTDGSRMMISPVPWSRPGSCKWVTVDLSMIVWQHFLYTGAPYRDHWRCVKMHTLLEAAEKRSINVVINFRNVEFDPTRRLSAGAAIPTDAFRGQKDGTFRGEMSTNDWILRLRNRAGSHEYSIRQRKKFDEVVSQGGSGLRKCDH